MEYLDHSKYKKILNSLKQNAAKKPINESVEEGNAFTRALAKTPKGGEFKVGSKKFKDKSGYDDPNVKEYQFDDMYPDDPGPFESDKMEGLNPAPMQATGQTIDTVEGREDDYITDPSKTDYNPKRLRLPKRTDTAELDYDPNVSMFRPDYMDVDDPEDDDEIDDDFLDLDDDEMYTKLPKNFQRYVSMDKYKSGLREAKAPMGLEVLSVSEREQLAEYVKSVKTIQQEIKKLVAKAHEGKMGGNRYGMVMPVSEKEEGGEEDKEPKKEKPITSRIEDIPSYEEIESKLEPELHDKTVSVLKALRNKLEQEANLTPLEIEMFIKHEIKKIARKAIEAQHDPY